MSPPTLALHTPLGVNIQIDNEKACPTGVCSSGGVVGTSGIRRQRERYACAARTCDFDWWRGQRHQPGQFMRRSAGAEVHSHTHVQSLCLGGTRLAGLLRCDCAAIKFRMLEMTGI
jgi:hypothetical protein